MPSEELVREILSQMLRYLGLIEHRSAGAATDVDLVDFNG
jgi:hypothetical protein